MVSVSVRTAIFVAGEEDDEDECDGLWLGTDIGVCRENDDGSGAVEVVVMVGMAAVNGEATVVVAVDGMAVDRVAVDSADTNGGNDAAV